MTHPKPFGELSDEEKGKLLLAHHEGKRIERHANCYDPAWMVVHNPLFCDGGRYRIAPEPLIPDSINWDHVAPEWKYMAREADDSVRLYRFKPVINGTVWTDSRLCIYAQYFASYKRGTVGWKDSRLCIYAQYFASYKRGTVGWKDSLVIRPGHGGRRLRE
jgi:hypothetical protein